MPWFNGAGRPLNDVIVLRQDVAVAARRSAAAGIKKEDQYDPPLLLKLNGS